MLIVGGGAGLGAVLARMVVEEGAAAQGLPTASAACDIQQGPQCHAAFEAVAGRLGRIDTLVNCAAIYPRRPLLEITDADWDASNGVNIKGTYHMMVAAVRLMQAQEPRGPVRGRIVNLASVDAFKAHPQNAHYAATKAAVVSLTKSFAHHVAPDGILVNAVAPAGMATERARQLGFLEELAKASPLGRGASPEEIAQWVIMAGGPRNTYMTGETVIVSGGYIYA